MTKLYSKNECHHHPQKHCFQNGFRKAVSTKDEINYLTTNVYKFLNKSQFAGTAFLSSLLMKEKQDKVSMENIKLIF